MIGGGFERDGNPGRTADHRAYPGVHAPGHQGAESAVEQTLSRLRALDARGPSVAPPPPGTPVPAEPRNLADLYRDHRMRMVRLAVLLVDDPNTAEDVVQEAFTGLHRRRTARDYVPPHQVNARSAESLAMLSAEHQSVVDALGTLPPRQREVLVLRYYGGMSEAEIADATGISRGTVKSTASRALDAVQRAMAGRPGRG